MRGRDIPYRIRSGCKDENTSVALQKNSITLATTVWIFLFFVLFGILKDLQPFIRLDGQESGLDADDIRCRSDCWYQLQPVRGRDLLDRIRPGHLD